MDDRRHNKFPLFILVLFSLKTNAVPIGRMSDNSSDPDSFHTNTDDKQSESKQDISNGSVSLQTETSTFNVLSTRSSDRDTLDKTIQSVTVHYKNFTTTTLDADNSTETSDFHSSFNLAIIPVMAAVVFTVAVCLKCCQWFRRYTRGHEKDDNNQYAVIVCDGDEDYGHVDMLSESASTNYDTVSSFCSFLKRSGNNDTLTSIRSINFDRDRQFSESPRKWLLSKLNSSKATNIKNDLENSDSAMSVPSLRRFSKPRQLRPCSTSSDDTETDPLNSSDASIVRRNNRFRVSFVTDNKTSVEIRKPSARAPSDVMNTMRLNTDSKLLHMKRPSPINTVQIEEMDMSKQSPEMVTVGTQTNKSFRYSQILAQKRHRSESGVDRRCSPPSRSDLLDFPTEAGVKSGFYIDSDSQSDAKSNDTFLDKTCNTRKGSCIASNKDAMQSQYPIEPTVKICNENNSCESELLETDLTDDVFVTENETDGVANAIQTRCECNKIANEDIQPDTHKECTAQTGECRKSCRLGKQITCSKLPKSFSDPVHLKLSKCTCACNFQDLENKGNFNTDHSACLKHGDASLCATVDTGEEMYKVDTVTRIPVVIRDKETVIEPLCPCVQHVCQQCTVQKPSASNRNNSDMSNTRSISLTSLESSGYAEELSSDESS